MNVDKTSHEKAQKAQMTTGYSFSWALPKSRSDLKRASISLSFCACYFFGQGCFLCLWYLFLAQLVSHPSSNSPTASSSGLRKSEYQRPALMNSSGCIKQTRSSKSGAIV